MHIGTPPCNLRGRHLDWPGTKTLRGTAEPKTGGAKSSPAPSSWKLGAGAGAEEPSEEGG